MKKYKALEIDFKIPEALQEYIDDFLENLNERNGVFADCYEQEIRYLLNECREERRLTEEQIKILWDYYYRGGIYCTEN